MIHLNHKNGSVGIKGCKDCPCYRDPDPRPDYCALSDDVRPEDGRVPEACPLRTLQVRVHGQLRQRLEANRLEIESWPAWMRCSLPTFEGE